MDWTNIDTVLLDMDGTLLDLHFDTYFWLEHLPVRYAQLHRMDQNEAQQWLHARIMQEQGTLNWYCLDYWSKELKVDIKALKREISERIAFRPHVHDFLMHLDALGIRRVIVTNAHQDSLALKLEQTGLDKLVDRIICSHDYQIPKEQQAFWHRLQEDEPFDPARTLLVDDSLPVLASAREYGIAWLLSILQPDSQQPEREITDFNAIGHFNELMKR
ncbi:putative hydrolase of the HAD superfamily [Amphritea atlantica]|uniref:Putative hydrolase of the HAD superfamily n=1 Tax=Amphritea atlantica TaxID=355243 RepID=A0A1H9EPC3_9GAMM|nr:GMP/IMP nucleotidase [Amphritea atlantica]SEQ27570.1 putative hydrolase of the HAD superfamily [Amphritea atlantica]